MNVYTKKELIDRPVDRDSPHIDDDQITCASGPQIN